MLRQIRTVTKGIIDKAPVPTLKEILKSKSENRVKQLNEAIEANDYKNYLEIAEKLCSEKDPVNIVAALMKMQFEKEMSYDYTQDSIEEPKRERSSRNDRNDRHDRNDGNGERLFFSIGKRDGLSPKSLVKFITERADINGKKVNKIDILESFSFVTIDKDVLNKVIDKCSGHSIGKRKVNIEVANKKK